MAVELVDEGRLFRTREIWFVERPYDVADCASVTFRQCREKVDLDGFARAPFTTLVIDLTRDLDALWQGLDAKSCRYKINRGAREGIEVAVSSDYALFDALHRRFVAKKGLKSGGFDLARMHGHTTLFLARHQGAVIAGQLYLHDAQHMRYLLGASERLGAGKGQSTLIGFANRQLMWEAIKYAKARGMVEFDLGGYYTGDDPGDPRHGINAFKRGFGGQLVTHYHYSKCYSPLYSFARALYRLVAV